MLATRSASPLLVLVTLVCAIAGRAGAAEVLPSGFGFEQVGYGPFVGWGPSSFAFLPDGRLVMIDLQAGAVRLNPVGAISSIPITTIPDIDFDGSRGLLGVAVDPGWPARPYLYFYFSHTSSFGYLVMFTASGSLTDPQSTNITLGSRYDVLTDLPDNSIIHNGGTLRFGPDGMLYLSLGEDSIGCDAQDLTILSGEILRLDMSNMPGSGSGPPPKADITPSDNPFFGQGDNEGLVWAWGLRNPFRFTIDEPTGDLYIGDVGPATWEEVDIVPYANGGADNYGWPQFEGFDSTGTASSCGLENTFTDPVYVYPNQGPTSIVCGPLYHTVDGSPDSFPVSYDGSLFIVEHFAGWIRRLVDTGSGWDVAPPVPGQPSAENWAEGFEFYADVQLGPDGALYLAHLHTNTPTPQGVFRIVGNGPTDAPTIAVEQPSSIDAFPNPVRAAEGTTFRWAVANPGAHSLRIVDASGRVVRTLTGRIEAGNRGLLRWNGRTGTGNPVAAGVYAFALEDPAGRVLRGKITVLR